MFLGCERTARVGDRRRHDRPVGGVGGSGERGSFPLGEEAHRFLVGALARSLSEVPQVPEGALAQADRAIAETLEYHAHVCLRRIA
jgi:DNA repair protein RecO (recombination protein O)